MNPPRTISILLACGARPNFMKIASLVHAFRVDPRFDASIIHTGQHFDPNMSSSFFSDLDLPEPAVNLGVAPASHALQTAEILRRFEPILLDRRPDWVVVVGDVNSTIACALAAAKLGIRLAHVEAGLRSFDRSMPEEINRVLTDRLSDRLFVTEPAGMVNLAREGVDPARCHLVGDTMADTLLRFLPRARASRIVEEMGLTPRGYAVLTLHRAANVDRADRLREILDGLATITRRMPVVFPVHPRTLQRIERFDLTERAGAMKDLILAEPMGYLDFLRLLSDARVVLTDSGGVQEETTILGVPCLSLRETTERPYTVEQGTNRLVQPEAHAIEAAFLEELTNPRKAAARSELTDGRAGERIARVLMEDQDRQTP